MLRAAVLIGTASLTAYAGIELMHVFSAKGHSLLEWAVLALFIPCFAWTALGAFIALLGLPALFLRKAPPEADIGNARIAVLVPVHNEDPERVMMLLEVMFNALKSDTRFDFHVLSDTTQPAIWLAEQAAWRALCERADGFGRIFYRKRAKNEAKKAGNIRDFCMKHGAQYEYILVLDADSVMAADTIKTMVRRAQADATIGIIQVPPLPVRRATLFARWQQWAARVYGPLWAAGESLLAGRDGNYYGHNALIRTKAFAAHAGLGKLPGTSPLSGLIASHDFVEAALLRRAGYAVVLADDLSGSYEQCPTNLVDYAIRDKRWCQGNLQHLRVMMLPGLKPWSRFHMLRGAFSYLIAPIWLAFACVMLLVAAHDMSVDPVYFPVAERTLFPTWPVYDFAAARSLFALTLTLLFGPRLLAAFIYNRWSPMFVVNLLTEWVIGTLLAPALMVFQTVFVLSGIFGQRVPWAAQTRDDRYVRFREALNRCGMHVLMAMALGLAAYLVSDQAVLWTSPLIAPLLLSPFLAMLTSRSLPFLLKTPEDTSTREELTVYDRPDVPPRDVSTAEARAWHDISVIGSGILK